MNIKDILGSWKLKSFQIEPPEGLAESWGSNAHGLLIYSDSGYMSVSINKDVGKESESEFENLFDSILFYSGSYKMDGNTIVHEVTEASKPDRIGKKIIRYAELSGTLLTLTTPKESFGRAILVWQKA